VNPPAIGPGLLLCTHQRLPGSFGNAGRGLHGSDMGRGRTRSSPPAALLF